MYLINFYARRTSATIGHNEFFTNIYSRNFGSMMAFIAIKNYFSRRWQMIDDKYREH
jgi:hypothetical protein